MSKLTFLSLSQEMVYLDQSMQPELPHYNIGCKLYMVGDFDTGLMAQALSQMVNQQPALRTIIVQKDNQVFQQVLSHYAPNLLIEDCSSQSQPLQYSDIYLQNFFE